MTGNVLYTGYIVRKENKPLVSRLMNNKFATKNFSAIANSGQWHIRNEQDAVVDNSEKQCLWVKNEGLSKLILRSNHEG